MMKKQLLPFAAIVLWGTAGCFSPKFYSPADYDLSSGRKRAPYAGLIHLGNFGNSSGAGTRMLLREGNRIEADEYNRWVLLPEQLLRRRVAEQFNVTADIDSSIIVSVMLFRFETDREASKVLLEVNYALQRGSREQNFFHRFESRAKEISGTAVAEAMDVNVNLFIGQLSKDLTQFAKGAKEK